MVPLPTHRSRSSCLPRNLLDLLRQRTAALTQVSKLCATSLPFLLPLAHPTADPYPTGKQLVHYTAQPLFLLDPDAVDTGNSELPVLFELGEGSYFSEGDDYTDDPTISLLTGSEASKAKDPTVS